jgi:hypothetical protein
MADQIDPKDPDEEMGRTNPEEITGTADEDDEEFEDIDETDSDEDELES